MRTPCSKLAIAIAGVIALLTGCSGGSEGTPPVTGINPSVRANIKVPPCTVSQVKVWASSLTGLVYGLKANGATCLTTNGSSSGMAFAAPYGLATDKNNDLYVADVNNARVVVFDSALNYLQTLNMIPGEQPQAVCTSNYNGHLVVGVGDQSSGGGTGDVEFFGGNPGGLTMVGQASGVLKTFSFCAFDGKGRFFADGVNLSGGVGLNIVYETEQQTQMFSQSVTDSGCSQPGEWAGMYVQKGWVESLSVGFETSTYAQIQNFQIYSTLSLNCVPTYTALNGYTLGSDPFYQAAPRGGANGHIYAANYGANYIERAPVGGAGRLGGTATLWGAVPKPVGVASRPDWQL